MAVFDPAYYTNHGKITQIVNRLENMRQDLEEFNRSDKLKEVDSFLIHRIHEETLALLDELQQLEQNITEADFKKAVNEDL